MSLKQAVPYVKRQDSYHLQTEDSDWKQQIEDSNAPRDPIREDFPPVEELSECSDFEKRIDILRERIQEHRMRTGSEDCWYFGSFHLKYDYGVFWDNATKWHSEVKADGGKDLAPFGYRSLDGACYHCQEATKEMNKAWDRWKVHMRIQKDASIVRRRKERGLLGKVFGCFRVSK